ncbi:hypothetical protein WI40_20815 [Burkholderia ubonensis]|uniref:Uncharacterized protein n=2 Tax=Burkholderia ubonensis TaxID=101571 RepID=A0A102LK40_9BURK|nr:hypothetical protein WI31_33000 [Burkholderia ubonensis]KUZ13535.1 hypothetical protein WI29_24870 [Burkholderia ubonensis]KUZ29016.1 hypothetical protein WI30_22265 [Burkholderia ubonensis]KUZ38858.1 hypothetical protein WI32_12095 [Burkholderia ubonensis]KUZ54538.1 hypothetical protein WI33_08685 [Burkholderia ubonensis]
MAMKREPAAIREVAAILVRLSTGPAGRQVDMIRYFDGLEAVARRIAAARLPDSASRELAARYYCAGILTSVYGRESAIAYGIAGSLEQQVNGRASRRIFALLMRAGRKQGQAFMDACGHLVRG